jgi:hypothetical protein
MTKLLLWGGIGLGLYYLLRPKTALAISRQAQMTMSDVEKRVSDKLQIPLQNVVSSWTQTAKGQEIVVTDNRSGAVLIQGSIAEVQASLAAQPAAEVGAYIVG